MSEGGVGKKYQNHLFLFSMFVCFCMTRWSVLLSSLVDDVYLPLSALST